MADAPNSVYTVFSFIGFVLCAIPFYWHLEAWNTGTCMYMAWTGIGCLIQCINSIVWNGNMVNRAPVYCDIVTHIQVGLNVAIPACSLCINRRLFKITRGNVVSITSSEKRRAVIVDLLICIGPPILQMIAQYIIALNRYNIYEDFGPFYDNHVMGETFLLFYAWPVVIGCISAVYCVLTIYTLVKHERQFSKIFSSNRNLNRGRYLRLMGLSCIELLGTIPIGTYIIAFYGHYDEHFHLKGWESWSQTHNNGHYSAVFQIPSSYWKNNPDFKNGFEMYRWLLVACAFIFFAFFGFADEARRHYRLAFKSIATRVGYSTSSGTLQGSSNATSSLPYMTSKGGLKISVTTSGHRRDSMLSFSDQLSIPSISLAGDYKPDLKIEEYSPSDSTASSSVGEPETRAPSPEPVILPAIPPASVPPHFPDSAKATIRAFSIEAANAV